MVLISRGEMLMKVQHFESGHKDSEFNCHCHLHLCEAVWLHLAPLSFSLYLDQWRGYIQVYRCMPTPQNSNAMYAPQPIMSSNLQWENSVLPQNSLTAGTLAAPQGSPQQDITVGHQRWRNNSLSKANLHQI